MKEGEIKFSKRIEGKKGINQFRWDLQVSETESDRPYFIHFKGYLQSGDYYVLLKGKDFELKQDWRVNPGKIPHNW